jgi:hypothetical protein
MREVDLLAVGPNGKIESLCRIPLHSS